MSARPSPAWVEHATVAIAAGLVAFVVYTALAGELSSDIQRGVPFAAIAAIVLLRHPLAGGAWWGRLFDLGIAAAAIYAVAYVALNGELIAKRIGRLNPADVTASLIGLAVLIELARRTIGWVLPGIALAFAAYAAWAVPNASVGRVALAAWVGTDGVFGVAFGVMVGVVYVYMLLAALMERSGGTASLVRLAQWATRRAKSGPGLTTVVSSGLFGMASGSGVADVAAVGTANIPAMKQAGYSAPFAASVQALSSIGAQVMPPIMGSSAFILAELTGTPYARIAVMAIIPALLFYLCVAAAVHFEARRLGVVSDGGGRGPMPWLEIAMGVVPLVVLVGLLVEGMSPARAALWSIAALLALAVLRRTGALAPRALLTALREGTIASLPLWTATAVIGLIVAAVSLSGVATEISFLVVALAKHSLFVALVVVMIASIILGTALPTIAAYLLLVIMVAPALQDLGVPLVIAHFFVFYYGVTSDLTPPTALAPLTASALAGANFWQTCWLTMRIGLPIFVLPFAFVYQPALLLAGSPAEIGLAAASCALGVVFFSAGAIGFLLGPLRAPGRALLMAAGVALVAPNAWIASAGLILALGVFASQKLSLGRALNDER